LILDIGCGYGLPACWCLEYLPKARVIGIDPDPARVRIAGRVLRERGTITADFAPDLPEIPGPVDVILLLDMLHYLDDQHLAATLERSCRLLAPGGILVARFVIRPPERRSFSWYFEEFRVRIAGRQTWYRSPEDLAGLMTGCGFVVLTLSPTPSNDELFWLVGRAGETAE
jgi:cyclopropane fatty-acyl-phospholipid synthase-like methyltransferase